MHSRTFLQRLADQPRASALPHEELERRPLGFADVEAHASHDVQPRRGPLGFAAPEPTFVTELSFRRTITTVVAPMGPSAGVPIEGAAPGEPTPGLGHATSWDGTVADDPVLEAPVAEERVPFYKREISLRRRKDSEEGVATPSLVEDASDEAHEEKREIGFVHTEPETPAVVDLDEPETLDAPDEVAASLGTEIDEEEVDVTWADDVAHDEHADVAGTDDDGDEEAIEEALVFEPLAEHDDAVAEPVADEVAVDESVTDEPVVEPVAEHDDEVEETATDETTEPIEAPETPAPVADAPDTGRRSSIRARRGSKPRSTPKQSGGRGSGRRVVGVKIGASQIAAAVVSSTDGTLELHQLARRPLEAGIIGDGEVRDATALAAELKAFFDENKLPRKDVRIGISSNRIGVRTFDIVGVDDQARFDNAVRFKAHEVLPVSVHESVLDYRVIEERVTESGEVVRRVLLVVAPRDQVEPFVVACGQAGIKLGGVDLEALGLLRAFVEPKAFVPRTTDDTATVAVSIGHEATTLLVAGGGTAEFTRVFDWGGGVLQQAIAQELDVLPAEATTILKGLSLSGPGRTTLDDAQRTKALDAVRARLTPFARELVSSLQFYQTQPDSLGIGELVITGGTTHLEGLADALHQMIGVAVRVGDPLARVVVKGPIDPAVEATLGSMAVPIGLAIEDEAQRSVNLLPPELRQAGRKRPSTMSAVLPLAAVIPIAALGFMFMKANDDVSSKQAQLDAVQVQIDALPEPTRPDIDAGLEVEQQQRAASLATILGGRLAWDRVMGDLSRVLPANVWLTKFTASTPDPAVAAALAAAPVPVAPGAPPQPTGVTIEGYTYDLPDVARLLTRLSALPSMTNVVLAQSAQTKIGKKTAVSFTILADINKSGGAQ